MAGKRKWIVVAGGKYVSRRGKLAWTYDRKQANAVATMVGGTVMEDIEFMSRYQGNGLLLRKAKP